MVVVIFATHTPKAESDYPVIQFVGNLHDCINSRIVRSMILERKLGFLQKVLNAGSKCVSSRLVEVMCESISSLCLVRECREVEEMCGAAFTDRLLKGERT